MIEYEYICDGFSIAWSKNWDGYPISASLCHGPISEKHNATICLVRHSGPRTLNDEAYMKKCLADCLEKIAKKIRESL